MTFINKKLLNRKHKESVHLIRNISKKMIVVVVMGMMILLPSKKTEAAGNTKIHFISLNSTTDAILLESNGHYGMVDSGEDWDYPDSPEYPLREGVTKGIGYEQQVIHYLEQLGVEKLDFYIATHSHSDHIGSGDEILEYFPTKKLYINEYKDAYLYDGHRTDPKDPYYTENTGENRLWDNQYVYDQLIDAARKSGTEIILNLDDPGKEAYRSFTMGDMKIEIMNYERDREEDGTIIPVPDDNCNSLVVKVTAFDKVALLTSDMDPWRRTSDEYGDTAKIAHQLIEQLWSEEDGNSNGVDPAAVKDSYPQEIYEEENGVVLSIPDETYLADTDPGNSGDDNGDTDDTDGEKVPLDESKVNDSGKTVSIDLLKMVHHSIDYNNTTYFLTSLNPKTVVITGYESWYNKREQDCMPGAKMFATATDSAAVVAEFSEDGIQTGYVKTEPEWMEIDGRQYYFDANGRTFTDSGNHDVDGEKYCFDEKGAIDISNRWVADGPAWRYWRDGKYVVHDWVEVEGEYYYCNAFGIMVYDWQMIDGKFYYFDSEGVMQKNTWIGDYYVDQNGVWLENLKPARWVQSGGRWWYRHSDGGYTVSNWEFIDGNWYYFDGAGWMMTGWQLINGVWYYLEPSGKMAADTWIGEYYVNASGAWEVGRRKAAEWIQSGGRWWYRHADGGYTASDWEYINGSWYYFDGAGWMVTGWQFINHAWYYLDSSGKMAADTWIGDYYVNASGVWDANIKLPSRWILSGSRWWYCHEDGSYTVSDWEDINGKRYYFDEAGWMVTGWRMVDEKWYYMDLSGAMLENVWVGNYYLKSGGVMATSEWVENGRYFVDETGKWVPNA